MLSNRFRSLLVAVSLVFVPTHVLAAVYFQNSDALPKEQSYDFIVVGSGAGGGVVAARIAENKDFKVLVIEAGPSDQDIFEVQVPGLHNALLRPPLDWGFDTVNQTNANGRSLHYTQGKLLGGCTSTGSMIYTRGSRDDYDRWANVVGDKSFSWDQMLPYILETERFMGNVEHQNMNGHVDPSVHGRHGKLAVTAPYSNHPINDLILETSRLMKDEFPFKLDMNDGKPIGLGWNQLTINQGFRSGSASAFLATAGNNLHVLLNTHVTRVVPVGDADKRDFRTVEFATDAQSPRRQLQARREVIISGGIINTPQILLNSGIGPKAELESLGIQTLVDNPSVGKNLSDQAAALGLVPTSLPTTIPDATTAIEEWNKTHTGPLSRSVPLDHSLWFRLPDNSPALQGHPDPSGGINSPHIEYLAFTLGPVSPGLNRTIGIPPLPPGTNLTIQFFIHNIHSVSRGSVSLSSTNPFDHPLVDFNLLGSELDVAILREGIRSIQRFFAAPTWEGKVSDMILPSADTLASDELMEKYLRSISVPILQAVGSASMSPKNAAWGVVDPDFKVKGAAGLRIVDASVLPFLPSAHTQVPVHAFAERAAALIRQQWK